MNLVDEICKCVAEELSLGDNKVNDESSSENTEGWDSLGNLKIILAVEDKFGIRFKTEELPKLNSILKLSKRVEELIAGK